MNARGGASGACARTGGRAEDAPAPGMAVATAAWIAPARWVGEAGGDHARDHAVLDRDRERRVDHTGLALGRHAARQHR
jgi:hypothetical protein